MIVLFTLIDVWNVVYISNSRVWPLCPFVSYDWLSRQFHDDLRCSEFWLPFHGGGVRSVKQGYCQCFIVTFLSIYVLSAQEDNIASICYYSCCGTIVLVIDWLDTLRHTARIFQRTRSAVRMSLNVNNCGREQIFWSLISFSLQNFTLGKASGLVSKSATCSDLGMW